MITIVSQARDVIMIAAPELSGGLGEGAPFEFESAVEAVLRPPHWLLLQRRRRARVLALALAIPGLRS